jgi:hypothetical protein
MKYKNKKSVFEKIKHTKDIAVLLFSYNTFPNAHIRTNAFMISFENICKLRYDKTLTKSLALKLEGGRNSITNQLLKYKLRPVVVGKDGKGYDLKEWAVSNTFRTKEQENLNDELFSTYSQILFDRIKLDGIDLNRVTLNGEEIVVDKRLASGITGSNLQSVGVLSELQVRGETLIYNTLYTGNQRVGINTLQPASALSIWDEEIEISIGKKQKDIGFIGSNRQQALVLGTNNKINLMLNSDGSVTATKLNLGGVNITSSDSPPNYNAPRASIVFNSNPSLGGPMGWVSLGEARWANFGIIE